MSLTFILGPPGSGKTRYCLDAITRCQSDSGLFYIVPEQFTLQAERLLVERSSGKAVMHAQALSFGRLAYHVFSRTGGAPAKHLNDTGKHMLVRKVLQDCNLEFYARSIQKPGFIENLTQTLTEFSQYELTPSALSLQAERLDYMDVKPKLADLALIYSRYKEEIAGRYLVSGETLDLLADALSTSNYLKDGIFWIDGFKDFTPQEHKVLQQILTQAKEVYITFTMDRLPIRGSLHPMDFFYATKREWQELHNLAENLRIPVKEDIFLAIPHRHEAREDLKRLTLQFPYFKQRPDQVKAENIKLITAADKTAELIQAAKWIRRNVIEEKRWKFSEVAILCGDLTAYDKISRNIFEQYGIPFFADTKMGLMSHPLTELIRAVLDIIIWDWQYEGVFRLLKTGFINMPQEEIDKLENYALARGIKGWRWGVEWLSEEDNRLRLREMLAPLVDGLKGDSKITVDDFAKSLYSWLYSIDAPGTLSQLLVESENQEEARWHKQIWPRIGDIFDKFVEILGEEEMTVQAFAEVLDAGLQSADLGLIPPSLDQVLMGDISRSRFPEIKALWVLGANDGQLPPPIPGSSLLTEDERERLRSPDFKLAPGLSRQMSDSFFTLYVTLCQPSEELILSYSRAGANGKPLRPSSIVARIKKIFPNLNEIDESTESSVEPQYPEIIMPISDEATQLLYGEKFITSASQLEAYVQCPFAHFLQQHLKAKERAIYEVRPADLGVLYHEVMAKATESENWHLLNKSQLEDLAHFHAEAVVSGESDHVLQSSARNKYILERLKSICGVSLWALGEQYRRGNYITTGIETGAGNIAIGENMIVTGRIDRVDTFDDYVKIIDYKSGNTKFSLEEVQAGTQLQLLLYMNALLKKPNAKPGGVFYFNIDDPILRVNENLDAATRENLLLKEFRMSGLVLADEKNISAMDMHLLSRGGDSPVIPVSVTKSGLGKRSSIANLKEFAELASGVEEQVKGIGEQMMAGHITPGHNKDACRYCRYVSVCKV